MVQPAETNLPCRVVARETVDVATALNGLAESVLVDVGTVVTDGQILARIGKPETASMVPQPPDTTAILHAGNESQKLQASAASKRASLARAEALFRRQELLNREGATPRLVYESALAERNRLTVELLSEEEASRLADNSLAKLLDRQRDAAARNREAVAAASEAAAAEVHAPVAGLVVERNIAPGEAVNAANREALFRIAPQPQLLRAEFEALPPGERISFHVGNISMSAVVGESGKFADFETRTVPIRPGWPCTASVRIK